jgi:hypothetical protein
LNNNYRGSDRRAATGKIKPLAYRRSVESSILQCRSATSFCALERDPIAFLLANGKILPPIVGSPIWRFWQTLTTGPSVKSGRRTLLLAKRRIGRKFVRTELLHCDQLTFRSIS